MDLGGEARLAYEPTGLVYTLEAPMPRISGALKKPGTDYLGAMPKIPGLRMPSHLLEPPRLDFGPGFHGGGIISIVPPKVGRLYTALVPLPDSDGMDKAGIRLPEVAVPLGTYTGWNLLNAATGAPDRVARYDGSFVPFARTEAERAAAHDPRPSIAARYPTKGAFVARVRAAANREAKAGFLLAEEIDPLVADQAALYDRIMAHDPADKSCKYLFAD